MAGRTDEPKEDVEEISEDELESFISPETDASYFEKAQDFKHLIKTLRIKYLGLKPQHKSLPDGSTRLVFLRDKNKITGINREGIESVIRFLEPRLTKHVLLTDWTEPRMFEVMMDDMITWYEMMVQNLEKYELSYDVFNELRILINDELEYAYRRAIDNKERKGMIPASRELIKALGLSKDEESQMQQANYPLNDLDALRRQQQQRAGDY